MNFDWNNLKENLQKDALTDGKKVYETDERFYKLARNENDTGGALIRLLPDPEGVMFIKMTKINANAGKGKRFCTEWSPTTIGMPDPFNERWAQEWNAGNKEEAKRFGRSIRYVSNIKVLKDPANPENEGKIFLLDMSQTIFEKVKAAAEPTPDEVALGTEPKQVYNPLNGNSFLYKVKRGSNNFITYEDSKFDEKTSAIYDTEEAFLKDIKANGYKLDDFLKPEFFKSYDELKDTLEWYTGEKDDKKATAPKATTPTPAPKADDAPFDVDSPEAPAPKAKPAPKQTEPEDDLDDLLSELA